MKAILPNVTRKGMLKWQTQNVLVIQTNHFVGFVTKKYRSGFHANSSEFL